MMSETFSDITGSFIDMGISLVFQYLARKYLENLQNADTTEQQNVTKNLGKIYQFSSNLCKMYCVMVLPLCMNQNLTIYCCSCLNTVATLMKRCFSTLFLVNRVDSLIKD